MSIEINLEPVDYTIGDITVSVQVSYFAYQKISNIYNKLLFQRDKIDPEKLEIEIPAYILKYTVVGWRGIKDNEGNNIEPEFTDELFMGEAYKVLSMKSINTLFQASLKLSEQVINEFAKKYIYPQTRELIDRANTELENIEKTTSITKAKKTPKKK